MKESMKHRLVGAAVLVGLGVIAWPVIFDTTPVREISQRSQIPARPTEQPFVIPEPDPVDIPPEPDSDALREAVPDVPAAATGPEGSSTAPSTAQSATQTGSAVPSREPVPPVKNDARGLPEQWAVQLGVFSDRANATDLKARAEKAGFHALVQSVGNGPTRRYRVYAEPKLERAGAQRAALAVERKLGIKGYVTRYYP